MATPFYPSSIGTLQAKPGLNIKIIQLVDKLERRDLKKLAFLFRINEREWESVFEKQRLAGLKLMQILSKEHKLCLKLLSEYLQCCNRWVLSEDIEEIINSERELREFDELLYQDILRQEARGQPYTMDVNGKLRSFLIEKTSDLDPVAFDIIKSCFENSIPDSERQEIRDNIDLYRSLSKKLALDMNLLKQAFILTNEVDIANSIQTFIEEYII